MKQHKYLKITISLILLIALITAASIFLSYNVLKVRTFSYETDKAVDPVRAVVISDLHEHEFGKDNVKLVEKIREQEPDIILMVGDFVNQDSADSTVAVKLVEQLSKLARCAIHLAIMRSLIWRRRTGIFRQRLRRREHIFWIRSM